MNAIVLQGDARALPLPDASVDLIVTSPPYFGLRSYTDGGEHYGGQLGSEATPQEWVAALVECTAEFVRVLKPSGSMFVNLGDKYSSGAGPQTGRKSDALMSTQHGHGGGPKWATVPRQPAAADLPPKTLLGLPWRYALACTDQLGLILRRDIIWAKPNGLPESVTDRCRSSHEYVFHMVRQPRYYAAVDEIREPHLFPDQTRTSPKMARHSVPSDGNRVGRQKFETLHPLGKLPGSVWSIPSQPLQVPPHLGVDHFAAFPMELPRRCVLGWSPPGICTSCGEGRRPVVDRQYVKGQSGTSGFRKDAKEPLGRLNGTSMAGKPALDLLATITGYACACTPYTDHPGTGETSGEGWNRPDRPITDGGYAGSGANWGGKQHLSDRPKVGPWREYHFDGWTPPPTRPAVILDPFGGTGTTALVASMHGRIGVSIDRSADYTRLARWRTTDPGERAKAMQVAKPPPVPDGMETLF